MSVAVPDMPEWHVVPQSTTTTGPELSPRAPVWMWAPAGLEVSLEKRRVHVSRFPFSVPVKDPVAFRGALRRRNFGSDAFSLAWAVVAVPEAASSAPPPPRPSAATAATASAQRLRVVDVVMSPPGRRITGSPSLPAAAPIGSCRRVETRVPSPGTRGCNSFATFDAKSRPPDDSARFPEGVGS